MAQLGSRLIDGVAKNMADKFFASFAAAASSAAGVGQPVVQPVAAAAQAVESPGIARSTASPAPGAPAAPQAPAVNTSWFRRISEWFMSLWR
jgi:hypothetical protein